MFSLYLNICMLPAYPGLELKTFDSYCVKHVCFVSMPGKQGQGILYWDKEGNDFNGTVGCRWPVEIQHKQSCVNPVWCPELYDVLGQNTSICSLY